MQRSTTANATTLPQGSAKVSLPTGFVDVVKVWLAGLFFLLRSAAVGVARAPAPQLCGWRKTTQRPFLEVLVLVSTVLLLSAATPFTSDRMTGGEWPRTGATQPRRG